MSERPSPDEPHIVPSQFAPLYFRSEDPVRNLRIQIDLRCVRAAPVTTGASPIDSSGPGAASAGAASPDVQSATTTGSKTTSVIGWQQKIYGQKYTSALSVA